MIATYIQTGNHIDYTPAADLALGEVIVQGELVGIAPYAVGAGQPGSLAVTGVFDLDKASGAGTAIPAGTKIYWDAAQKQAVTSDGGGANKYVGKSIHDAADTASAVRVRLSQ